jgi:predicted lactoylglutathione lyase
MIAHISLSISDLQKSKAFYADVLAPLGYRINMDYAEAAGFNDGKNTDFWISQAKTVVPTHVAFQAASREQVESFHESALAAGAKDNGAPGYRDYEAVWYDYSKAK